MQQPRIDIAETLKRFAGEFDRHLERFLRPEIEATHREFPPAVAEGAGDASATDCGVPGDLAEAVRYAALAPGKRVRPFLVVRCCELAGGRREDAWAAAAAVECVHAFSLVHDDLPAMDDDDLRRGQPTTHKRFGEALGILAGDALVVRAFEIIAREYAGPTSGLLALELAGATGWAGMIGGQADDLSGQKRAPSLELTCSIHVRKTGRLFAAACRLGARVAVSAGSSSAWSDGATKRRSDEGKGTGGQAASGTQSSKNPPFAVAKDGPPAKDGPRDSIVDRMGRFGLTLGEGFQIADDILDLTATAEALGKSPGKDAVSDKQTYPRCVGVEESRAAAGRAVAEAIRELEPFGPEADDLRALARYVAVRDY